MSSPIPHGEVTLDQADLIHVLMCALSYDVMLPYSQVPPAVWAVLTDAGKDWVRQQVKNNAEEERRLRRARWEARNQPLLPRHSDESEVDALG